MLAYVSVGARSAPPVLVGERRPMCFSVQTLARRGRTLDAAEVNPSDRTQTSGDKFDLRGFRGPVPFSQRFPCLNDSLVAPITNTTTQANI